MPIAASIVLGALGGGAAVWFVLRRRPPSAQPKRPNEDGGDAALEPPLELYVHTSDKTKFYQKLGDAWDHEVKDFKALYRPCYPCGAKKGSYEAHVLAVSHYKRWDKGFVKVSYEDLDERGRSYVIKAPRVWHDPAWPYPADVAPVASATPARVVATTDAATASGRGTRSHDRTVYDLPMPAPTTAGDKPAGPMIFYCADYCPFAQRVWIALLLTGLRFEYRETNLWAHHLPNTKKFREASASKTVPTLSVPTNDPHKLTSLDDSIPLLLYLDRVSHGALTPDEPTGVHRTHQLLSGPVPDLIS